MLCHLITHGWEKGWWLGKGRIRLLERNRPLKITLRFLKKGGGVARYWGGYLPTQEFALRLLPYGSVLRWQQDGHS